MNDVYKIAVDQNLVSKEDVQRMVSDNERSSNNAVTNLLNFGVPEVKLYNILAKYNAVDFISEPHFVDDPQTLKKEHLDYFHVKVITEDDESLKLASWRIEDKEKVVGAFENLYRRKVVFVLVTKTAWAERAST